MSALLYWLAAKGYELAIRIAARRNPKAAEAVRGRDGLIKEIERAMRAESRPRIWMHCASAGEAEQGRSVLDALRERYPDHAIVITFFSPSGYHAGTANGIAAHHIFYLPFDDPSTSLRLVSAINPALAVWVKYEFWYFTLRALKKAGCPTLLIAAVINKNSGMSRWVLRTRQEMLSWFTHVFAQDEKTREELCRLGIERVSTTGDPRYDRVLAALPSLRGNAAAEFFSRDAFIIVAGSTWPEDEQMIADALPLLPSNVRIILVPHEIGIQHLRSIDELFGKSVWWLSAWRNKRSVPRVMLVDRMGKLMSLYRYAQVAYVGGGFGRAGVHNVLEPAAHGAPVIIGPQHKAYLEAVDLVERGGAVVVTDAHAFVVQVLSWINDEELRSSTAKNARTAVESSAGATGKIVTTIEQAGWLNNNGATTSE